MRQFIDWQLLFNLFSESRFNSIAMSSKMKSLLPIVSWAPSSLAKHFIASIYRTISSQEEVVHSKTDNHEEDCDLRDLICVMKKEFSWHFLAIDANVYFARKIVVLILRNVTLSTKYTGICGLVIPILPFFCMHYGASSSSCFRRKKGCKWIH